MMRSFGALFLWVGVLVLLGTIAWTLGAGVVMIEMTYGKSAGLAVAAAFFCGLCAVAVGLCLRE